MKEVVLAVLNEGGSNSELSDLKKADMYQPDSLWPSKVRVNPTAEQIPGGEFCTENAGLSKITH